MFSAAGTEGALHASDIIDEYKLKHIGYEEWTGAGRLDQEYQQFILWWTVCLW